MDDFKNMLEKQMQKAKASSTPVEPEAKAHPRRGDQSKDTEESGEVSATPVSPGEVEGGPTGEGNGCGDGAGGQQTTRCTER